MKIKKEPYSIDYRYDSVRLLIDKMNDQINKDYPNFKSIAKASYLENLIFSLLPFVSDVGIDRVREKIKEMA